MKGALVSRSPWRWRLAFVVLVLEALLVSASPTGASSYTITPGGPPVTVLTTVADENASLTFAGTTGQRISLKLSSVTFGTSTCCSTYVTIFKPDSTKLAGPVYVGTSGGFIDAKTLPQTGTYTISLNPQSSATGTMTVTLYDVPADATGTITPGGAPVSATVTTPGQNASLTFGATAGQRLSFKFGAVAGGAWKVSVANPDATTLVSSLTVGTSGAFVDTKTLAQTGTYTISLNPQSSATGTMTVTVYDVPADATGTITPGGAPVSATVTTPGQNASLTFAGTAGQRISLKLGNVTIGSSAISGTSVSILNPDATTLASVVVGTSGGFLDTKTLPQTGTYTIRIDPQGANTGSITLTLYNVPPDATGAITVGGGAVAVTTTTPGQNASLTFSGTAGVRVSINVSNVTIGTSVGGTTLSILNPDQTRLLAPRAFGTSGAFIDPVSLSQNGTYTIVLDPQAAYTGSATLTLYNVPADVTGTIIPGGAAVTVTTTAPGQNASLTFAGTAGRRISMSVAQSNCCGANISIKNPDGSSLLSPTLVGVSGGFIDTKTLPQSGTYTIFIDPRTTATGSVTITLYDVPADITGTITPGGAAATVTTTTPGQNAKLTFSGTSGTSHTLTISAVCCTTRVTVLRPDSTVLKGPSAFGVAGGTMSFMLPVTGTYSIVVDPQGSATGSVTLALS